MNKFQSQSLDMTDDVLLCFRAHLYVDGCFRNRINCILESLGFQFQFVDMDHGSHDVGVEI